MHDQPKRSNIIMERKKKISMKNVLDGKKTEICMEKLKND